MTDASEIQGRDFGEGPNSRKCISRDIEMLQIAHLHPSSVTKLPLGRHQQKETKKKPGAACSLAISPSALALQKEPTARAPLPKTFFVPSGHLSVITRPPKQYSFPSLGLPNFPPSGIRAFFLIRVLFSLVFLSYLHAPLPAP